jgi:hypothetical protein
VLRECITQIQAIRAMKRNAEETSREAKRDMMISSLPSASEIVNSVKSTERSGLIKPRARKTTSESKLTLNLIEINNNNNDVSNKQQRNKSILQKHFSFHLFF